MSAPRTVAEEIRDATREAHVAMKDLKALLKECREERERIENAAIELVTPRIQSAVEHELSQLGPLVRAYSDQVYDRLTREAERCMNNALFGNDQGRGKSVFDMVAELTKNVETAVKRNGLIAEKQAAGEPTDEVFVLPTIPPDIGLSRADRRRIEKRLRHDPEFRAKVEAKWKEMEDEEV